MVSLPLLLSLSRNLLSLCVLLWWTLEPHHSQHQFLQRPLHPRAGGSCFSLNLEVCLLCVCVCMCVSTSSALCRFYPTLTHFVFGVICISSVCLSPFMHYLVLSLMVLLLPCKSILGISISINLGSPCVPRCRSLSRIAHCHHAFLRVICLWLVQGGVGARKPLFSGQKKQGWHRPAPEYCSSSTSGPGGST